MANDIIEELDMEPKPESLWWTSSYKEEDKLTLKVGGGGKDWDLPYREVFDVLGYGVNVMGKAHKGSKRHCAKGWVAVARRLYIPLEKRFFDNEMPAGDQPCLQHCTKQQRELDTEY